MKLMVTADDYGMTTAVTDGILACIRNGVLTQTGLFTNMPSTEYAVKKMLEEFPDFCLGQDINFSTGSPITDPKLIPSMVQENGAFLTSKMHRQLDKTNPHHVTYEDAFLEGDNQVKRFIELVGKKPAYIGGHAYHSTEILQVLKDLCKKYGVIYKTDMCEKIDPENKYNVARFWSRSKFNADGSYDFSMQVQIDNSPLKMFKDGTLTDFSNLLKENGTLHIRTHCGFVDGDLIRLSSFNMIRAMEAEFICSEELKKWVKENQVELVNAYDYQ